MELGLPELILVLVIVMLVFGVGRVSKIGSELGGAIRQFRDGLKSDSPEVAAPPTPEQKG